MDTLQEGAGYETYVVVQQAHTMVITLDKYRAKELQPVDAVTTTAYTKHNDTDSAPVVSIQILPKEHRFLHRECLQDAKHRQHGLTAHSKTHILCTAHIKQASSGCFTSSSGRRPLQTNIHRGHEYPCRHTDTTRLPRHSNALLTQHHHTTNTSQCITNK